MRNGFRAPAALFISNVSIETPPLTPDKPVTADDLVSADGACPGMAPPRAGRRQCAGRWPPARAVRASQAPWRSAIPNATWCAASARRTMSICRTTARRRVAVITYSRGPRAGIYTFTAGRLTSIERGARAGSSRKAAQARRRRRSRRRRSAAPLSLTVSRCVQPAASSYCELAASHSSSARCSALAAPARALLSWAACFGSRLNRSGSAARCRFSR